MSNFIYSDVILGPPSQHFFPLSSSPCVFLSVSSPLCLPFAFPTISPSISPALSFPSISPVLTFPLCPSYLYLWSFLSLSPHLSLPLYLFTRISISPPKSLPSTSSPWSDPVSLASYVSFISLFLSVSFPLFLSLCLFTIHIIQEIKFIYPVCETMNDN